MKIKFKKTYDTKNKVRFDEIVKPGEKPSMGAIYFTKKVTGTSKTVDIDITFGD